MAEFNDFDIEIQDDSGSDPEHFNGTVATAATPVTITPASGNPIKHFQIEVPGVRDPLAANAISDAIYYSLDAGATYSVLMSGESIFLPGNITDLRLDTNANGTSYRVILWT